MNFDPMWSVQQNSDVLFWQIAIPVMFAVITSFTYPDLVRMVEQFNQRKVSKRAEHTVSPTSLCALCCKN